jgi:hypothetical protein
LSFSLSKEASLQIYINGKLPLSNKLIQTPSATLLSAKPLWAKPLVCFALPASLASQAAAGSLGEGGIS